MKRNPSTDVVMPANDLSDLTLDECHQNLINLQLSINRHLTSHILLQFSYPEKPLVVSGQRQLCQQAELIAHLKCWSPVQNSVEEAGCLCFLLMLVDDLGLLHQAGILTTCPWLLLST